MQDQPSPSEILAAAAAFLRTPVKPESAGHAAFIAKVTSNALDIARRELDLAPAEDAAELARLKALLKIDGTLFELNRLLSERLAQGVIDLRTPGVAEHLWTTTMAKLAVDQPTYSSYRAELAARAP
jgi:hypothetical protein